MAYPASLVALFMYHYYRGPQSEHQGFPLSYLIVLTSCLCVWGNVCFPLSIEVDEGNFIVCSLGHKETSLMT